MERKRLDSRTGTVDSTRDWKRKRVDYSEMMRNAKRMQKDHKLEEKRCCSRID